MKRFCILFLIMLSCFCFIGCKEDLDNDDDQVDSKISIKDTNYILEFYNDYLDIVINKSNGSINQLKNLTTSKDYIEDSEGGNFSFEIDTSTSNPFHTDTYANQIHKVASRDYKPIISYEYRDKDLYVFLNYTFDNYPGLSVQQKIVLEENATQISVDYTIDNQTQYDSVVTRFTGLIISGLKDDAHDLSLLYPRFEGKTYPNAVYLGKTGALKLDWQYPSSMSMQLLELFNDTEALYYYVEDKTREYKNFNFGDFTDDFDQGLTHNDDFISLSVTQYPYVASGNSKALFTTIVGVESENSWYKGADLYREFLISSKMNREYNDFVSSWTGVICTTIAQYGDSMISSYLGNNNPADMVKYADNYKVDTIMIMGWHKGGFDSAYPDYEFYEGTNFDGREGFEEMVSNAHTNGDYIIPYINGYMACSDSIWGNTKTDNNRTNIENGTVKKNGFRSNSADYLAYSYNERYTASSQSTFYAMCPKDAAWQNKLLDTVSELVACGVDGLWLDQLLEMPARLCFDESHGHTNPATAYGEGYKELLTAIDEVFLESGNNNYLLFGEGITDAYMEWIDIAGLNWRRYLYGIHGSYPMQPQITEYTMPQKQLGISGASNRTHAYAFLFASPFIDGNNSKDLLCTNVYLDNPEIYFQGRFMDYNGIVIDNEYVKASLIVAGDQESIGIQLYNTKLFRQTVTIDIDLSRINISKELDETVNLFNGNTYQINNGSLTVVLEPDELTAIKITLK